MYQQQTGETGCFVSVPEVLVIAGTIPVNLLAAERMEIYKEKTTGNHTIDYFRETPFQNGNDDETMKTEGWLEIWRDEFLRCTDVIGSRII